jgi:hypothetical protein
VVCQVVVTPPGWMFPSPAGRHGVNAFRCLLTLPPGSHKLAAPAKTVAGQPRPVCDGVICGPAECRGARGALRAVRVRVTGPAGSCLACPGFQPCVSGRVALAAADPRGQDKEDVPWAMAGTGPPSRAGRQCALPSRPSRADFRLCAALPGAASTWGVFCPAPSGGSVTATRRRHHGGILLARGGGAMSGPGLGVPSGLRRAVQ